MENVNNLLQQCPQTSINMSINTLVMSLDPNMKYDTNMHCNKLFNKLNHIFASLYNKVSENYLCKL